MKHQLNIIIGSTRPGRVGPVFAEWLEDVRARARQVRAGADRHRRFRPAGAATSRSIRGSASIENEHTKAWSKAIAAADAFVFVTPEYNYFARAGDRQRRRLSVARMGLQAGRLPQLWRRFRRPARRAVGQAAADHGQGDADPRSAWRSRCASKLLDEDGVFKANDLVKAAPRPCWTSCSAGARR